MTDALRESRAITGHDAPLKIDIVVHGRFHGFALAKALISLGHDVLLHTNYPKYIVAKFGVQSDNVRSFLAHGVSTRGVGKIGIRKLDRLAEGFFHKMFGRWAAGSVRKDADFVYGFSGVMEEFLLSDRKNAEQIRCVARSSAHISEQSRLLEDEEARVGKPIDRPSRWMIDRELREYDLADKILVLSTYSQESFIKRRVPASRLVINPLGVDVERFRTSESQLKARESRILGGAPLRVLNVGTFSAQKGAFDMCNIAKRLHDRFQFQFVGTTVTAEVSDLVAISRGAIEFRPRLPEFELPRAYAEADIFVYPTIQDGFSAVLLQAAASGLPIISTGNCGAGDFVVEGRTGWILPIRDPDAFVKRLQWCDEHRSTLVEMGREIGNGQFGMSWEEGARDLVRSIRTIRSDRSSS